MRDLSPPPALRRLALAGLVLAGTLGAAPAAAAPAAAKFLLLSPRVQRAADKDLAPVVGELVLDALSKGEGIQALGEQDVLPFLTDDAQSQLVACDDDSACLLQIGGALGVDYLVAPSIGSIGNKYMLTLRILQAKTGTVAQRASQEVPRTEAALGDAICPFVQRLLAGLSATEPRVHGDPARCAMQSPPVATAPAAPAVQPKKDAPAPAPVVEKIPAPPAKEPSPEPSVHPHQFALRGGYAVPTGLGGVGLEVLGSHWSASLGTGLYALGAAVNGYVFANGGPYLSAQALLVRPGPAMLALGHTLAAGNGFGAALVAGYDFRPLRQLSLRAGLGLAYNSAAGLDDTYKDPFTGTERVFGHLVWDLSAGYVFDAPF